MPSRLSTDEDTAVQIRFLLNLFFFLKDEFHFYIVYGGGWGGGLCAEARRGIRIPLEAGVTGSCAPYSMGARNLTPVL